TLLAMTRASGVVVVFCVIFSCHSIAAEQTISALPPLTIKNLTGEVITYDIKQGILKIGSAKMIFEGLVTKGSELSVLIHVMWKVPGFKTDERIYVDPQTFRPRVIYKDRKKFGCKIQVLEDYFPVEGKVSIGRDMCGVKTQQVSSRGAPVESIYAMIYHLRMNSSIDDVPPFTVHLPDRDEHFKLEEIKKLNFDRQSYQARHFVSETFGIWIDPSHDRLPLRIDSSEDHKVTMVMRSRTFSLHPEKETEEIEK
ncbi:MAG: hypothetical protein Q7T18_04240, partial [Sedimentisphaerales bacterium]|nr:hypothetical protein [Sedimentisphaerales bacterium]